MTITRTELVAKMVAKAGELGVKKPTKKDADAYYVAMWESIRESLGDGEDVELFGYADFTVVETPARKARNPQTGEEVNVPSRFRVRPHLRKKLKDAVR